MQQLAGICLLTREVKRLRDFYGAVLERTPEEDGETYVSFSTGSQVLLSIYAFSEMEKWTPEFLEDKVSGRASLEFAVDDADVEYRRLIDIGAHIVRPPTTYPWGLRAVWFTDPDGNLVTFHAPAR